MSASIARHCPQCHQYYEVELKDDTEINCPQCKIEWGQIVKIADVFNRCPVCTCRQFYTSKDFNQFLGCGVMVVGIILVPFTYGLSLPAFAFIDWLLHKRVGTIINCYRCGSEFRDVDTHKEFKPFMHHIGLKYDKYR